MNTNNKRIITAAACLFAFSGVASAATTLAEPATQTAAEAAPVAHDAKALEIIDTYIEKIGGEEMIKSIVSTKMTGTLEVPMAGLSGSMTMMSKVPGMVSMVMDIPGFGKSESGFDGTVGWSSDPMGGPRLMTDEETKALKEQADPTIAMKYRERYPTIEYAGESNFEGKKAHKIRLVDADGEEQYEFFDIASSFMVGQEGVQSTPMGDINMITVMSDYKEFGGMQMPTKITQKIGPQEVIITIKTAEMNTVEDGAFELPAAIQALVKAQDDG
jgi:hypothetical protein